LDNSTFLQSDELELELFYKQTQTDFTRLHKIYLFVTTVKLCIIHFHRISSLSECKIILLLFFLNEHFNDSAIFIEKINKLLYQNNQKNQVFFKQN